MPTQIKQIRDEARNATILRIEGEILRDDAVLIKTLVDELLETPMENVVVDLADLDYLDSEGGHILSNLASLNRVSLEGIEIFLQTAVNEVERQTD